ncbi:hypothetical protein EUX98_g9625 [Antrodiella citrinella]|uniref:Uncharacterized protein n=1 Tax=Antrodiella citrinella TaxID=2447956 RepID=A0A4S4LPU5_9APHY|nr:hypothetical protein EUX98_g9625 [Antrodiella citrinella]
MGVSGTSEPIAAAPAFPGLRRFPEGRNFEQWTGNNSKALMKIEAGLVIDVPDDVDGNAPAADDHDDEDDVEAADGPRIEPNITLSVKPAYTRFVTTLAEELDQPSLPLLIRRFIYDQLYSDLDANDAPDDDLPDFNGRIAVHYAAFATFYAPSELCGPGGMHREAIRSNPNWRNEYARYDTVLVQNGDEDVSEDDNNNEPPQPIGGMLVARVLAFLAFSHEDVRYPCAMVEWFLPHGDEPDPVTGMWLVRPEMHQGHRTSQCLVVNVYH